MHAILWHLGDHMKRAGHLNLLEEGALRRLLDIYYSRGMPLPATVNECCRLASARSKSEKAAIALVLGEFFTATDLGYCHERCDQEISKAEHFRALQVAKGKLSAAARRQTPKGEPRLNRGSTPVEDRLEPEVNREATFLNPYSVSLMPSKNACETETEIHDRVKAIKSLYPQAAREDWITGEKLLRNRVTEGASWEEITAGVERYAAHCRATGRLVQNPGKFFGDVDRPWTHAWAIPQKPEQQAAAEREQKTLHRANELATSIGFREKYPSESVTAYLTAAERAKDLPAPRASNGGLQPVGAAMLSHGNRAALRKATGQ